MDEMIGRDALVAIMALQPPAAIGATRACKLCEHPSHHFDTVDFNTSCDRVPLSRSGICVEYFRCQRCELIFTDFFDRWRPEDFSAHIYNDGYASVDPEYVSVRPMRSVEELAPSLAGGEDCRILDYGSGTGLFETGLRARGFTRVESYDPFSRPERPDGTFDIVTCFDVIEHSPTPRQTLADIMSFVATGGIALIGQTLQPADISMQRGGWWYIAPRNGHVAMFSCETLHLHAEAEGLDFVDFGGLFAFGYGHRSPLTRSIIARRRPQVRRVVLHAPAPASGTHEAWHEAEETPFGSFRWTREAHVGLGMHATPRGLFRVMLSHLGRRDDDFLARSRIRVGTQERPIEVHEGDLYAVFDLPSEAVREISLRTPVPHSDAAAGTGPDLRSVGLAITCAA